MNDRRQLTKAQRWTIADALAAERLPIIDAGLKEVHPSDTFYARHGKRLVDIAVSGAALIVTAPINLVLAGATFLDVGKPIMFAQERVGKDGQLFKIYKFRNMTNETDENGELLPAAQRVTKWGHFVRKTSLDELLNFWSVFKGDMSIIGPRPLVPEYTHRYNKRHRARLCVRPGLECPPKDIGGHVWTWQEQFDNDIWYVENISFATDFRMLINLVHFAFNRKSADARASVKRSSFMGYNEKGVAISVDDLSDEVIDAALKGNGS